ncbi:MAG TPA: sucrase ferredoxin [Actinomycetota bacterium]|nr:sucrase ferredoxin [Actinomycetota bacterium]
MPTRSERCSHESEARAESLAGTASTVRSWLLLEHPGPWGRDAPSDARLPEGLGAELAGRCRAAGVRPLLIRRSPGANASSGVTCFAVRSGPGTPWIERTTLGELGEALEVDLDALGRGERPGLEPHGRALFLVCTHGRRDVCCAERGRPLARALARAYAGETWESSHIGGDRYAGNLLAFPHGLYFGRVRPEEAAAVAGAYLEGRLALGHLRGRSCFPMVVQAAEIALRQREGLDGIDDVAFERVERDGDLVRVTLATRSGRVSLMVSVEASEPRFLTCQSAREEAPPAYRIVSIEDD